MTDKTAIYLLRELDKASRGFDWFAPTPASQNALIRAIQTAVAYGKILEAEKRKKRLTKSPIGDITHP